MNRRWLSDLGHQAQGGSPDVCRGRLFKGSFIQVNKEHGQQVAGPYRIRWWLQNV